MQDATQKLAGSSFVHGLDRRDARLHDAQSYHSFSDAKPPQTRGKKRMRRIQIELPFFRRQVRELELKLKLKRLKLHNSTAIIKSESHKLVGNESDHKLIGIGSDHNSVYSIWNGIAERQLQERLRVEQQQQQLKETRVELKNLSVELHKLLNKCDESQQQVAEQVETQHQQQRYWDFNADPADEIYADQLSNVARIRLQMQRQRPPSRTLYLTSGLSMGPELVKRDPSVKAGVILQLQFGTMLPFGLDVATEAYWRFFGCTYGMQRTSRDEADLSTGMLARAFKTRMSLEGVISRKGSGKYIARRYMDEDGGVTIVWAGGGDVEEVDGHKFIGVQLYRRGWIKLRPVPRQGSGQSTSTIVEASFETVPVIQDSVVDKVQQLQAFLDMINRSFHIVDKFVCQRMGSLLLEADWKATFGCDST